MANHNSTVKISKNMKFVKPNSEAIYDQQGLKEVNYLGELYK